MLCCAVQNPGTKEIILGSLHYVVVHDYVLLSQEELGEVTAHELSSVLPAQERKAA